MSRMSRGSNGSKKSQNCSMSRMSRISHGHFSEKKKICHPCHGHLTFFLKIIMYVTHIQKSKSFIYHACHTCHVCHAYHACHVCHACHAFHGDLNNKIKSKCMSCFSHGSKNPKLSCTLCHIFEWHACHTCHACHRDLVLEFSDKNTKTMS